MLLPSRNLKSLIIEYRAATTAAVVAGLGSAGIGGGVAGRDEVEVRQTSAASEAAAPRVESTTTTTEVPTTTNHSAADHHDNCSAGGAG